MGRRPVRLVVSTNGAMSAQSETGVVTVARLQVKHWHEIGLMVNAKTGSFDIQLDGKTVLDQAPFPEPAEAGELERICFRTGAFRDYDAHAADLLIDESKLGDRLDGDVRQPLMKVLIDDVSVTE
jgi:hypothetical protein